MAVPAALLLSLLLPLSTPQSTPPPPPSASSTSVSFSFTDQSTAPTAPPPPPSSSASSLAARQYNAPATAWIYDTNCPQDNPPFGLGKWIQVTEEECPIAFSDPTFYYHEAICSYTGLASLYPQGVEPLYTWAYNSAQLCANTPACLACPALLQCDWMLLEDSCKCNGVTAGSKGECKTSNSGGPFCYVDSDSTCEDKKTEVYFVWGGDSGIRHLSNTACQQSANSVYTRSS